MRPSWQESRYNDEKINLSNNVCYDIIVLDKINSLLKTKDFNFRQYPDEYIVYKSISNYHNVNTKNIAIGYGLGELITRVLKLKKIKKLSIVTPTWPMVEVYSNIYGIEHSSGVDFSANALYIANPNGVTGKCLSKHEIIELLDKFELVIVDEAYGEFSKKEFSVIDIAADRDNLIVLKTLSKSLGLAGLRFGYAISNEKIIYELQINRPSCIMNSMLMTISDELFEMIPSHITRMNETKEFIHDNFDCDESHGNFVLIINTPAIIQETFIVKEIPNFATRMSLTNLHIFKDAINNRNT